MARYSIAWPNLLPGSSDDRKVRRRLVSDLMVVNNPESYAPAVQEIRWIRRAHSPPKKDETIKLWTVQRIEIIKSVFAEDVVYCSWEHIPAPWREAYGFMMKSLNHKGDVFFQSPPFWGWKYRNKRKMLDTMEGLLSVNDFEEGRVVLLLEIPSSMVVSSSYDKWNEVLNGFVGKGKTNQGLYYVFSAPKKEWVQFCFPHLCFSWISELIFLRKKDDAYERMVAYVKRP